MNKRKIEKSYTLKELKDQEVLITGGLGFIGSNLAHSLIALKANVTIYDACLDPYGWNFANIKEIKDKVTFLKADTRDMDILKKHIKEKDIIFDCAAQLSHTISMENPFLDIDINVRGTLNVVEATRQVNDKAKLIYASTRGVIGKMLYSPIDENHPTNPVDINGINKLTAEKYYMLYNKIYGLNTTSIRINNTYGIRSQMKRGDYSIINWFIGLVLQNKPIPIYGDGSQTRDYNYVQDVVDAIILTAQRKESTGEIFMLGSGQETKLIDAVNLIIKLTGKGKIEKKPWPKERKNIEIGNFLVSYEKINSYLGWHPKTGLENGLRKTIQFYQQRLQDYL